MFTDRDLDSALAAVREQHAPRAVVLDAEQDFETLDPAVAEQLGLRADELELFEYDPRWVPDDAPDALHELASDAFTVGAPGDGGVTWTRQTDPPFVFVKPRTTGSPDAFVDFLIGTALVEIGTGVPEQFLGFFGARYLEFAERSPLSPVDTYQLAAALYEAYKGVHTRGIFAGWADDHPDLYAQWVDAGERLQPRLDSLSSELARNQTSFAAAAELACAAVKHAGEDGIELPAPFSALATEAYADHGSEYALQWATRTFDALGVGD
ncbi:hypothetical protein DM867_03725 [Halosegnis rubeus]|jgi:hypothetical protein|uniref:Uncharacterized protein n=1 Tax=Halosegnis rubeus TaxID=2212850 RepID=A0A5N5UC77_9EURY|nr:hypothetical protein [Halosegnis rubeus]KAB7515202.1 hypothetical protein DMP03_08105 [Halosegnis rubeus]KAB7516256.1 hypothetical protein DM867_03725 [Halosegnis rubeus]KAB7517756.1 hypothetical protein DP108_09395 [Halosegnis rubeus]